MFEISKVFMLCNDKRLGYVNVKYFDLILRCDICLFKEEKLWIRFPEIWKNGKKHQFVYWETKDLSDNSQEIILNKLFDMIGLTLEKAIEMKKIYCQQKKRADKNK